MAITATQTKNPGSVVQVAVGRYITTGTAAAFNLTLGFNPRYFRIENLTDRNGMEWFEGMDDDSALKTVAAGTKTLSTSLGITVSNGVVTVGLDTDVNVTSKQLSWIAIM